MKPRCSLTYIKDMFEKIAKDDRAGENPVQNRLFHMHRVFKFSSLGLVFSAFLFASLPGELRAEESSPSEKGKEIATKLCARCHSVGRDDESKLPEAPPFRTFADKWPLESLEEALAEGIVVGHPAMPEFMFAPEDIQNLLSHIASLSR